MPKSSSANPQPRSSSSRPKRAACSRLAIAAVSVTSKISRRGSIPDASISAADRVEHLRVADRLAREVDLEAEAALVVRAHRRDRVADDPLVELLDQAEALGRRHERVGRDHLALVAAHPDQHLPGVDRARRELEDRLEVGDERVAVERRTDPLAPGHRRLPLRQQRVLEGDDPVAAHRLRAPHRELGPAERLGNVGGPVGEADDAAGGADRDRAAGRLEPVAAEHLQHVLADRPGALDGDLGEDDRELIAAEPRRDVRLADPLGDHGSDLAQELVAVAVSERLVDALEVVEAEHEQGAAAVAGGPRELLLGVDLEPAAVGEAGERVAIAELLQPVLDPRPLARVADRDRDRAARSPDRRRPELDLDLGAVPARGRRPSRSAAPSPLASSASRISPAPPVSKATPPSSSAIGRPLSVSGSTPKTSPASRFARGPRRPSPRSASRPAPPRACRRRDRPRRRRPAPRRSVPCPHPPSQSDRDSRFVSLSSGK